MRIRLRFTEPRLRVYLLSAVGLFVGFPGFSKPSGFSYRTNFALTGIATAQMTGAALMVSASFTFLIQVTVMQRLQLQPMQFVKLGLLSLMFGASIIASFETFPVLAIGMAFLGTGLGLSMPAISAGASLAVDPSRTGRRSGAGSRLPGYWLCRRSYCRWRALPD